MCSIWWIFLDWDAQIACDHSTRNTQNDEHRWDQDTDPWVLSCDAPRWERGMFSYLRTSNCTMSPRARFGCRRREWYRQDDDDCCDGSCDTRATEDHCRDDFSLWHNSLKIALETGRWAIFRARKSVSRETILDVCPRWFIVLNNNFLSIFSFLSLYFPLCKESSPSSPRLSIRSMG